MLRILLSMALALSVAAGTAYAEKTKKDGKPKQTAEERFKAKDTNSDNKLSLEEFKGKETDKDKLEKLEKAFKAMDTDKDGFLSLDEYKAGMEKMKEHHKKNK